MPHGRAENQSTKRRLNKRHSLRADFGKSLQFPELHWLSRGKAWLWALSVFLFPFLEGIQEGPVQIRHSSFNFLNNKCTSKSLNWNSFQSWEHCFPLAFSQSFAYRKKHLLAWSECNFCRCNHASEKTLAKPTWFEFVLWSLYLNPHQNIAPIQGQKRGSQWLFLSEVHFLCISIVSLSSTERDWLKVDWPLYNSPFCLMFRDLALLAESPPCDTCSVNKKPYLHLTMPLLRPVSLRCRLSKLVRSLVSKQGAVRTHGRFSVDEWKGCR